jgi:hypothetical protein
MMNTMGDYRSRVVGWELNPPEGPDPKVPSSGALLKEDHLVVIS